MLGYKNSAHVGNVRSQQLVTKNCGQTAAHGDTVTTDSL